MLREAGTERAFTGEYTDTKTEGVYRCRACGAELFRSDNKFDRTAAGRRSSPRWPRTGCATSRTAATFMKRVEVRCATCDSHLGHVFAGEGYDTPTDQRYCINSISLTLEPAQA